MVCNSKAVRKAQIKNDVSAMMIDQAFYNKNFQEMKEILERNGASNVRKGQYASSYAEFYFVFEGVEVRIGRDGNNFSIASDDTTGFTTQLQEKLESWVEKAFTPLSKQHAAFKLVSRAVGLGKEKVSKRRDNPLSTYVEVSINPKRIMQRFGGRN